MDNTVTVTCRYCRMQYAFDYNHTPGECAQQQVASGLAALRVEMAKDAIARRFENKQVEQPGLAQLEQQLAEARQLLTISDAAKDRAYKEVERLAQQVDCEGRHCGGCLACTYRKLWEKKTQEDGTITITGVAGTVMWTKGELRDGSVLLDRCPANDYRHEFRKVRITKEEA